jgi:hypothetical protein
LVITPLTVAAQTKRNRGGTVKVDIGEVLTRAWQISWKYKSLWWFGIFTTLLGFSILPLALAPMLAPFLLRDQPELVFLLILVFMVLVFGFFVLMYPVSAIVQTALAVGVLQAEQETEQISLVGLVKDSLPFFWRILGVMAVYALALAAVSIVFQVVMTLLTVVTFGLAMFCMMPLMILIYPLMFLAVVWLEQSVNSVVIDDMPLMDAILNGWQIIRNNLLTIVVMVVVIYFGLSMVSSIFMVPLMIPFFIFPFSFIEGEFNWTILSVSLLCGAAFIPLIAVVSGWVMVFSKSAWIVTYLRLTRPSHEPQPILQETPA